MRLRSHGCSGGTIVKGTMLNDPNFQRLLDKTRSDLANRPENTTHVYDWALQQFRAQLASMSVDTFDETDVDKIAAAILSTYTIMVRYLASFAGTPDHETIRSFLEAAWDAQRMILVGLYDGLGLDMALADLDVPS